MKRLLGPFFLFLLTTAGAAQAAPSFTVVEGPAEIRIETSAYSLAVTREGFAWTLSRGGTVVLKSAPASGPSANAAIPIEGKPERATALKTVDKQGDRVVLEYGASRKKTAFRVEIRPLPDRARITTVALHRDPPLHDIGSILRFELGLGRWYGAGFQGWRSKLALPLNDARIETAGFVAFGKTQASPFWYSTNGVGVWVRTPRDFRYAVNRLRDGKPDGLIHVEMPATTLTYELIVAEDVRSIVRGFLKEVGYPKVTPPDDYFRLPIYTTWVEHKVPTDQAKVLEFAFSIQANKLPCGVIEIDDKWEAKYGDMQFDETKFPTPKEMVDQIHRMGMKVTLWVHPFVNTDSATFAKLREDRRLLHDGAGNVGIINWWNGNAAIWDFSRPDAAREFRAKLDNLRKRYGIDGFKFDGADSEMVPQEARAADGKDPIEYCDNYNRETTAHYQWNETRVGIYSQKLGVVQRLIDKHSIWGPENGLAALIPEMIIVSLRGYPYAMPDMIGGNQYDSDRADKELLIRWAQASALMPLIQFSIGPWHFDAETVRLAREASQLHLRFAPLIIELARQAPKTGEPILRPLWYQAPKDPATFDVNDQFMIGDDLLVAPVLQKGATARDLYLPAGKWRDLKSGAVVEGSKWLRHHPAPLDVLPVFVRVGTRAEKLALAK
ncbi:MAG TPA: glycoside hydrolase family 31 protein [Polyangia bacterium]|nr:glycoside hydrolase family 31 protein [Polyangia bacterium]